MAGERTESCLVPVLRERQQHPLSPSTGHCGICMGERQPETSHGMNSNLLPQRALVNPKSQTHTKSGTERARAKRGDTQTLSSYAYAEISVIISSVCCFSTKQRNNGKVSIHLSLSSA